MFPAPRDVFREKAEREALKKSKAGLAPRVVAAPVVVAAAIPPGRPKLVAPAPQPATPPRLVDVKPEPVVATPAPAPAPPPLKPAVLTPVIVAADPEPPPAPKPEPAPAPAPAPKPDARSAAAAYYGLSDGDGGKPKRGGGGDDPPVDRDVIMGAIIVILVLLLLAWLFMGREQPRQEEAMLQPAMAPVAPAAAPKPDALPPGPLDLRPSETPTPESSPTPTPEPTVAVAAAPTPEPTPTTPACPRGRMVNVFFCTASAELTPAMRSEVEKELANWGQCLTTEKIVVTGYADTRGESAFNAALASSRAEAAAGLLAAAGLTVVAKSGVGELDGLEDNQNCANQRRVDVTVQSSEYGPPSRSCAPPTEQKKLVCG